MTSITSARAIVVPALRNWDSTLIFCHGLGDTGAGFSFLAESYRKRSLFPTTAFIFPHAPIIPITCNGGARMNGWYDILSFGDISAQQDEEGMLKSVQTVQKIITESVDAGISSKRIILGGFSQGGVMSLLTGLTSEIPLGGIISLSCYLPMRDKFPHMITDANRKTPIFWGHGEEDPVCKFEYGVASRDTLLKQKCDVEWHQYPGLPHSVDMDEMEQVKGFIEKRLEANKPAEAGKSEL